MQAPDVEQHYEAAPRQGASKRRLRVYEQWQGNEKFFCWGYLVAGPNWKASIGTALLIAAPTGIYIAFVAVYMALEVHAIILVFSCLLPVLSLLFLMLTACRDPGIIPRQEPDAEYLSGQKPRSKEVYVNNQRVVIRYNDTCHFYQPPRAHHCSVNDNCIERFDHHCPWVGTTIGQRNYRTFLLFVYTTTVLCLYVFGVCLAQLFVYHDELVDDAKAQGKNTDGLWGKTLGKCAPAIAVMAFTFLFFWFVGGLSVFHAYLVGSNQTTYENFRYNNHDNRPNPYSRGVLRNCAEVWCNPIPSSKVRFRAYADEVVPPTGQPGSPYLDAAQMAILQGAQQPMSAGQQGPTPAQGPGDEQYQQQPHYGYTPPPAPNDAAYGGQALPISSSAGYYYGAGGPNGEAYGSAASGSYAAGAQGAHAGAAAGQQQWHAPDPHAFEADPGAYEAERAYLERHSLREDSTPPPMDMPAGEGRQQPAFTSRRSSALTAAGGSLHPLA